MNGRGGLVYTNGGFFIGDWMNSNKHGPGVSIYQSGDIYDGDYSNNHRNGIGNYIYAEGIGEQCEYSDGKYIKKIRDLTAEEVAQTKQKVKDL